MAEVLERTERRLRDLRSRLLPAGPTESIMLGLGAGVGLATGLLAALLIGTVRAVQTLAFGQDPGWLHVLLVPVLGSLVVGVLVTYLFPESSGSGVVETMRTVALRGGRFRARVPLGGVASTGLALGAGVSGGREAPIVLIGGSTGSLVGRLVGLGDDRIRTLVASGAAAGIGASFNAPIGGMLFAIELIIGEFRIRSMQVIVVASVVASVTARQIIGPGIIYEPRLDYGLADPRELLLYAGLGLAAVAFGLGFLHGVDLAGQAFARLRVWKPLRVALGGLAVGLIALGVPEVLGSGDNLPPIDGIRDPIQRMLDGTFGDAGLAAAGLLLVVAVTKLVATCLAVGSGNAVGTFSPMIFTGAALGGAVGHVADTLLPAANVQPGAFALVGMAAVFSAAARAPLTAILLVFELTGDYELVLPLMLAAGLAVFLGDRFQPESIYSHPLRKEGIVYAEPSDVDVMQTVKVGEIMTADPDTVAADLPLDDLREEFRRTRHHGFPVVEDGDRLVGVVTLSDLAAAGSEDESADLGRATVLTAGDVCTRQPVTVTPEDPVFRALRRMASLDVGRIPVVATDDHARLVGLVRRSDVVQAYQRAVTRSLGVQQQREVSRLRDLVGAQFVELIVGEDAPAANVEVRAVEWPERTILTSIRRGDEVLLPHGDTTLRPDDVVVVLTGRDAADRARYLLSGGTDNTRSGEFDSG